MSDVPYTANTTTESRSTIWAFFARIGNFLVAIGESNGRIREVERLQAMSDEELAARNLRREDIFRYVFRDTLHI